MNTAIVENIITEIRLFSKYDNDIATTTAIEADHGLLVEKNTSGKVMDVKTAHGIYAKKDFKNLFLILPFINNIGVALRKIMTPHKTNTVHNNFGVDIYLSPFCYVFCRCFFFDWEKYSSY